jgi:hypothetical protein
LTVANGSIDRSPDCRRQGNERPFRSLAHYPQDAVPVFFTDVCDVGLTGFKDP